MDTFTFEETVNSTVIPLMEKLCGEADAERENLIIQGQKAFGDHVPFAAGTLLKAQTTLLLMSPEGIGDFRNVRRLRELWRFALTYKTDTFGIMNLLISLRLWQISGVIEEVLAGEDLSAVDEKLNWRVFVDERTLALREGLPFNYYSVAYRVALLREALEWETGVFSDKFLDIYLQHARSCSVDGLFMDETMGEGRFDRYTTIVPAELAQICLFLGKPVPDAVLRMLKTSCEIYFRMANSEGYGYAYGRSLGAHGDTGALEVLPVAASLGLLDDDETALAYDYTLRNAMRIVNFWIDDETGLINMWDKGRKIDEYRNKKRIFEANLDIMMKLVDALELWNNLGREDQPVSTRFESKLDQMEGSSLHFFSKGKYERALAIIRQGRHVFHLPLINGGHKYYDQVPYLPLPYEPFFIEGSPDVKKPFLIPRLILEDGTKAMPLSYFKNIAASSEDDCRIISYKTDGMAVCGQDSPERIEGISAGTTYSFENGVVIREEEFFGPLVDKIREIEMEFCTFSGGAVAEGRNLTFSSGAVTSFGTNMDLYEVLDVEADSDYHTPNGPMKKVYKYKLAPKGTDEIRIRWDITYC